MIPEIVTRAVELGLWTTKRALDVATTTEAVIPRGTLFALLVDSGRLNADQQAYAITQGLLAVKAMPTNSGNSARGLCLARLIPHLRVPPLYEALITTLEIEWSHDRQPAIDALAPRLTDELWESVVTHIQTLALYAPAKPCQLDLIQQLAPYFPATLIPRVWGQFVEAFNTHSSPHIEYHLANTFRAIAPRLPHEYLASAVQVALAYSNESQYFHYQAELLAVVAPQLSGSLLEQVIAYGQSYKGQHAATQALILSAVLNQRPDLLADAVEAAYHTAGSTTWLKALDYLVPHLEGNHLVNIFNATLRLTPSAKISGLAKLLPKLQEPEKSRALEAAIQAMPNVTSPAPDSMDEEYQVGDFRRIAPFLEGIFVEKAREFVMTVKPNRERCYMLVDLASHMADSDLKHNILVDALAAALGLPATLITHTLGDRSALIYLGPHLSSDLLEQARAALTAPLETHGDVQSIVHIPEAVARVSKAIQIENERALAALAPKLSAEQIIPLLTPYP